MIKKTMLYHWNSYGQYIDAFNERPTHIDAKRIMDYFNSKKDFETFMNELIRILYENEKTSIRQLARVLDVSKGIVEKTL